VVNYEPVSLSCARSESRPFGLRPAGPLALLLAPHVPHRVRIVARASPSGLGACSRMRTHFCANPKAVASDRTKKAPLVCASLLPL
jgi:hypothetical protein